MRPDRAPSSKPEDLSRSVDPISLFTRWWNTAKKHHPGDHSACALATIGHGGVDLSTDDATGDQKGGGDRARPISEEASELSADRKDSATRPLARPSAHPSARPLVRPSVRMVLLKDFSADGFVFYTNSESRKGRDLDRHRWAALCFYWMHPDRPPRQVRVEGRVSMVAGTTSDRYFAGRDRASQIGAWASRQSRIMTDLSCLDSALKKTEQRFAGSDIPRPPFWNGYQIMPDHIEFWQQGAARLHERVVFTRVSDASKSSGTSKSRDGAWHGRYLFP